MSRASLTALLLLLAFGTAAGAPRALSEAAIAARSERPGKPTGPIAVEHRLEAAPAVGVPLAITITARVAGAANGLTLEITPTVPRAVLLTAPLPIASDDGFYGWRLTVVPLAPDAGFLNVVVAGEVDGVPQASTVTIALRSGGAGAAAAARPAALGEALIELPVRETP